VHGTRPFQPDPIQSLPPLESHPPRGGGAGELLSARGSHWTVLIPLRECQSARGNQRIYAPKGTLEAISPGGPLHAQRGVMRLMLLTGHAPPQTTGGNREPEGRIPSVYNG
jgi:hypothetical protein